MYSPLNAQLIQTTQHELASRQMIAEHRRALLEDRRPEPRRRRRLKQLAAGTLGLRALHPWRSLRRDRPLHGRAGLGA